MVVEPSTMTFNRFWKQSEAVRTEGYLRCTRSGAWWPRRQVVKVLILIRQRNLLCLRRLVRQANRLCGDLENVPGLQRITTSSWEKMNFWFNARNIDHNYSLQQKSL